MHRSQAGLSSADGSAFLPVTVVGDSRTAPQVPVDRSIEIMLPGGVCVRVGHGADLKVLRGVLTALRP